VTRGVVTWFDEETEQCIRALWSSLGALGVNSLGMREPQERPHVTYLYSHDLDRERTLAALSDLAPLGPVPVRLGSVGVFPPGVLHLPVVPSRTLLTRQERVFDVMSGLVTDPHPYHVPGRWNPHVTLARSVPAELLGPALQRCAAVLPIEGTMMTGGFEDAGTGESWIAPTLP